MVKGGQFTTTIIPGKAKNRASPEIVSTKGDLKLSYLWKT